MAQPIGLDNLLTSKYYSSKGVLFENGTRQLADRIANANEGSDFYTKFEEMFGLYSQFDVDGRVEFATARLLKNRAMKDGGYDALLLHDSDNKVYGYAVYQTKTDGTRHLFSHNTDKDYQKQGFGTYLAEQLAQLFIAEGVQRARFSAGGDPIMNKILDKMKDKGYLVENADKNNGQEGWIDLSVNPIQKAA